VGAFDFIVASTLHLLDMNWQLYDLSFLLEMKVPMFYMTLAKGIIMNIDKAFLNILFVCR